jgi:hypothetical protein
MLFFIRTSGESDPRCWSILKAVGAAFVPELWKRIDGIEKGYIIYAWIGRQRKANVKHAVEYFLKSPR